MSQYEALDDTPDSRDTSANPINGNSPGGRTVEHDDPGRYRQAVTEERRHGFERGVGLHIGRPQKTSE